MSQHDTLTQAHRAAIARYLKASPVLSLSGFSRDELVAALSAAQPAQAQQSIDAEALIRAVLPGGSSCDPQTVADEIRRYLGQWPGQASTFAEYMGCDTAPPVPAQPAAQPVQGVPEGWTSDQIADACIAAEIPDSKFESLMLVLTASPTPPAQQKGGEA